MNVPHNERSPGEDVMGQKGQREKLPESVIEYTTDSLLISINACICVSLQLPYIAVYPFLTLSVTIAMGI